MIENNFEQIPTALQDRPQWVLWQKELKNSRWTKVPYQANGSHAKTDDANSWATFTDVMSAYKRGGFDGIGFVFTSDDPFVGIDLDHCMKEGHYTSDDAKDIVEMLNSYTELSPSGEGVHIIATGEIPPEGKRNIKLGIEVYSSGRYFTFTGDVINHLSIEHRAEALQNFWEKYIRKKPKKVQGKTNRTRQSTQSNVDDLSMTELWNKMFNSKNGAAIKSLCDGQLLNDDHSSTDLSLCNHLAFWTNKDAVKMDAMFRETNLMREKWDRQHSSDGSTYGQMTIHEAIASCQATFSEYIEQQRSLGVKRDFSDPTEQTLTEQMQFNLTEYGNAERIKHMHGHDFLYCGEFKEWMLWDQGRWKLDKARKIEIISVQCLRSLRDEGYRETDEKKKGELLKWAHRCESRKVMLNSISNMQSMLYVSKEELDTHQMLFNCKNGVIDLETGTLLPHKREWCMTKMSPVRYDPNADCPIWKQFLNDVVVDGKGNTDREVIKYLQMLLGYSLTGLTKEQAMYFLYGKGKNGKSTFVDAVQQILGDYGKQTNTDTFISKKNDSSANYDIARLDGARFVAAVESEEGQKLSEALVKQLTGGDKVAARELYQNYFEFTPTFKIFFTTNYKPIIRNNDDGIWRRVHLIPFTASIPLEKQDKDLPDKLKKELPGILTWMVQGTLMWQREGLKKPQLVEASTNAYREEMDILAPFLQDVCTEDETTRISGQELFKAYCDYCDRTHEPMNTRISSSRKFYRVLEDRGFDLEVGHARKRFVKGIGIKEGALASEFREQRTVSQSGLKNSVDRYVQNHKKDPMYT